MGLGSVVPHGQQSGVSKVRTRLRTEQGPDEGARCSRRVAGRNFLRMSYSQGAKDVVTRLRLEIVGCASAYYVDHSTIREKRQDKDLVDRDWRRVRCTFSHNPQALSSACYFDLSVLVDSNGVEVVFVGYVILKRFVSHFREKHPHFIRKPSVHFSLGLETRTARPAPLPPCFGVRFPSRREPRG